MVKDKENKLILIPKRERYIEYMLNVIIKLPRTEKFSIGNEYKTSMYKMLKNICMKLRVSNLRTVDIHNENILNKISIDEYHLLKKVIES